MISDSLMFLRHVENQSHDGLVSGKEIYTSELTDFYTSSNVRYSES
jgi:hypothetical protein